MRTKRATRHAQSLLLTVSAGVVALLPSGARAQQVPAAEQVPVVTLSEARRRAIAVDPDAVAASQRIRVAGWERRAATALSESSAWPNVNPGARLADSVNDRTRL